MLVSNIEEYCHLPDIEYNIDINILKSTSDAAIIRCFQQLVGDYRMMFRMTREPQLVSVVTF